MGMFDRIFKGKAKGGATLTEEDSTAVKPASATAVAATGADGKADDSTAVVPVSEAALSAMVTEMAAETQTGVALQEAVVVRFSYGGDELGPLFELQHRLEVLVEEGRLGEVDGSEMATDGAPSVLSLFGPDADALFAAARPVLEEAGFLKGARVVVRYGGAGDGAREKLVVLRG